MEGNINKCCFDDCNAVQKLVSLKECTKDTNSHLRYFKCNTEIEIPESLLILNRAGVPSLTLGNLSKYKFICHEHRQKYGIQWKRPRRICVYPLHDGTKSGAIARGINFVQSREIWLKLNLHVPVGSGICRRCIDRHKGEVQIGTVFSDELKEMCSLIRGGITYNSTAVHDELYDIDQETESIKMNIDESEHMEAAANSCPDTSQVLRIQKRKELQSDSLPDENYFITDSEKETQSSQATTHSNWSWEEKSQRELYNEAMNIMSNGVYVPLKSQASKDFDNLHYSTQKYYIRQAREAFQLVCDCIAPGQSTLLMKKVYESMNIMKENIKDTNYKDPLTETIIAAYKKAEDHASKVQILSIIVGKYTKSQLLSFIEGLTVYKIDAARKYAAEHGPGQYVVPSKISRVRLPKTKIQHFIEFISAPCYLQVVGFGSKHLKLSSGLEVKVPKIIRTMIASRLISSYNKYCSENSFTPPCRATLYKIIKACSASQLKSLHGLDNYINDGMEGIETLKKMMGNLEARGVNHIRATEINEKLEILKQHLKNDFRGHIKSESKCIQHCNQFALSGKPCTHQHTDQSNCGSCDLMYELKHEITATVSSHTFPSAQEKEEAVYDLEMSMEKVWQWRDHLIRTVNQDLCKSDILQNLKNSEALIIADWCMKWIPQLFHETQSEWFGKQGISWHMICAVIRKQNEPETDNDSDGDDKYDIISMIHIIDGEGKQGWNMVSQIFLHAMKVLKSVQPDITDIFIRSDNAGCYHCLPLLAYLWKFRSDFPVNIKQYNFSEAQSGKDLCDSRTGTCRLHMINYINEGNNISDAGEMKAALESHGGIRNTYVSVVKMGELESERSNCGQIKSLPISHYNNFQFEDEGLRASKAYNTEMTLISSTEMSRIAKKLTLNTDNLEFVDPITPDIKAPSKAVQKGESFSCIEPDCIKVFKQHEKLLQHLTISEHVYDNEELDNLEDKSKRLWSLRCNQIRFNQPEIPYENIDSEKKFDERQGYALKRRKKIVRHSPKVKAYLEKLFQAGEDTGKKPSPYTVSKKMRNEVDTEGVRIFSPAEWLTHQQVRSYFGNLCIRRQKAMNKQVSTPSCIEFVKVEDANQDEDLENMINDLVAKEHEQVISNIIQDLTE